MLNFLEDHIGACIAAVLAACAAAVVWAVLDLNAQEGAFMAECVKDRKNYECVAMWRAGNRSAVPVPVIVPMR